MSPGSAGQAKMYEMWDKALRGYEGNFGKHGGHQHTRFEPSIAGSSPADEAKVIPERQKSNATGFEPV